MLVGVLLSRSSRRFVGTDVALSGDRPRILAKEEVVMSVVTALSLVLLVGFVATGLVGFLGWHDRMRESSGFSEGAPL